MFPLPVDAAALPSRPRDFISFFKYGPTEDTILYGVRVVDLERLVAENEDRFVPARSVCARIAADARVLLRDLGDGGQRQREEDERAAEHGEVRDGAG